MKRSLVYLDYAATTPVSKGVLRVMTPFLKNAFGNPSSSHALGQEAKVAVERARQIVASFLFCSADEIVFTSGATEANNLVIQGIVKNIKVQDKSQKAHIITSQIEHESVLAVCRELEKEQIVEVTYLPVDEDGLVRVEDVKNAIKDNTVLVSIQYANSEIGAVQPIAQIGGVIRKFNESLVIGRRPLVLFHTDATQAANYLDCNVKNLGVDFLTISSHKIYGPKGVGVLYTKKGSLFLPLLLGGGQEENKRSGTENVSGIVGLGEAIQEVQNARIRIQNIRMRQLRDSFLKQIVRIIPGVMVTGSQKNRLPNNIHIRIPGVEGKDLVLLLDRKGICVSTGSACSERSQEPSHVLLAMGIKEKDALSSLRITLGRYTTQADTAKTMKALGQILDTVLSQGV